MASADVLSMPTNFSTLTPLDTTTSIKRKRQAEINIPKEPPPKLSFNPESHLNFKPPSKIFTMEEIGLQHVGVSPNAVSEPFQLFTPDAIRQMRAETLRPEVFENCQYSSNLAKGQLRGYASA